MTVQIVERHPSIAGQWRINSYSNAGVSQATSGYDATLGGTLPIDIAWWEAAEIYLLANGTSQDTLFAFTSSFARVTVEDIQTTHNAYAVAAESGATGDLFCIAGSLFWRWYLDTNNNPIREAWTLESNPSFNCVGMAIRDSNSKLYSATANGAITVHDKDVANDQFVRDASSDLTVGSPCKAIAIDGATLWSIERTTTADPPLIPADIYSAVPYTLS